MTKTFSRRNAIQIGLAGGMLAVPMGSLAASDSRLPSGPNPMFPARFLKVLGFFDETDPEWYEGVHAPDFFSFAAPHMARYSRNWIKDVEAGSGPSFQVITEIHYKDEAAKEEVRRLMDSPAGRPLLEHTLSRRAARKPVEIPNRPEQLRLFSAEPHRLTGPSETGEAPTLRRRVLLLRRTPDAGQQAFVAAATAMARDIAKSGSGIGVSLDVLAPSASATPADAVIYLQNSNAALSFSDEKSVQIINVLNVETRNSVVRAAPETGS